MNRHSGILLLACLALGGGPAAAADSFIVHATASASGLTADDMKAIFNGRKTVWPDKASIIVVVPRAGAGHVALMEFLGKTSNQFTTAWKRKLFSGSGVMPKMLSDDAEVAAFVAKTPNAIGFIAATPPAGVTVIPKP